MGGNDPVSSTERLLQKIRGGDGGAASYGRQSMAAEHRESLPPFSAIIPFVKSVTVGVDIGYQQLKLVKVNHLSAHRLELLDYKRVPFEARLDRNAPEFVPFLRKALDDFCASAKRIAVWSAISTAKVETRLLRIPKVQESQINNTVFWTYKKEVLFDEKSDVLNFEILGEVDIGGSLKIEVMAYSAPKTEIASLMELFSAAGHPLRGVTIFPFAFQNLLKRQWLSHAGRSVCSLYAGRNWSRIDLFSADGNLALSRGVRAGLSSMSEAIRDALNALEGAQRPIVDLAELNTITSFEPLEQIDSDQAQRILLGYVHRSPALIEEGAGRPLSDERVFEMLQPALDRLIRQIERTFAHFGANFESEPVGTLYLSGEISYCRAIIDYLGAQLNLKVAVADPLTDLSAESELKRTAAQAEYLPALGLALSSPTLTPNFTFTYEARERRRRYQRINRLILALFFLLTAACAGYSLWRGHLLNAEQARIEKLQRELDAFNPQLDRNFVLRLAARVQNEREKREGLSEKYRPLAVLAELAALTPERISLLSCRASLGTLADPQRVKQARTLTLEGIVTAEAGASEAVLADFLLALNQSPLFKSSQVQKKSVVYLDNRKVLRFSAQIQMS